MRKVLKRKGDRDERLLAQGVYLPILAGSREKTIRCEGECVLAFPERRETSDYITRYCASFDYVRCSIAAAKLRYYERTE